MSARDIIRYGALLCVGTALLLAPAGSATAGEEKSAESATASEEKPAGSEKKRERKWSKD